MFDRNLFCFSNEERYTYCLSKEANVTVLIFILYSILVHAESPKTKMICLKSPKSSKFKKKRKLKKKKLSLRWDSTRNTWIVRLRNTCAKKTTENVF